MITRSDTGTALTTINLPLVVIGTDILTTQWVLEDIGFWETESGVPWVTEEILI